MARTQAHLWGSNVILRDSDTAQQIGECGYYEVRATSKLEAAREIRRKAWEDVDTRLNDVWLELLDLMRLD